MRPYEIMVIFDVDLDEGDIREKVERFLGTVRNRGGTAGKAEYWGRREFAYPVHHRSEGYYVVLDVTAEASALREVDRTLALEDSVLRHKVVRRPERRPRRTGSGRASARAPEAAAS